MTRRLDHLHARRKVQHRVVHQGCPVIPAAPGKAAAERARQVVVVEARVAYRDG